MAIGETKTVVGVPYGPVIIEVDQMCTLDGSVTEEHPAIEAEVTAHTCGA